MTGETYPKKNLMRRVVAEEEWGGVICETPAGWEKVPHQWKPCNSPKFSGALVGS